MVERKDKRISIEKRGYYQTDGVFCSFNCVMAYIEENKDKPLYRLSESLILKMYNDVFNNPVCITPAPHWRLLLEHGGHLTIENFRNEFNNSEYIDHGLTFLPIGKMFEKKIKF